MPTVAPWLAALLALAAPAGAAMGWLPEPTAASSAIDSYTTPRFIDAPPGAESVQSTDGMWLPITPPGGRREHAAIYDSRRGRMIIFGGAEERAFVWKDVWELALGATPIWRRLETTGTPPSQPTGKPAIYDPVRDRILVYYWDTLWELTLSGMPTWSILTPVGPPPPPRAGHSAIYDPVADRMVVFGGSDGTYLDDVWALSLLGTPAWTQLSPTGGPPPPRSEHVAVYDVTRREMVVHGGTGATVLDDVWTLSLDGTPTWTQLTPAGTPPAARKRHAAIYDPAGDRVVVFGGRSCGAYCDYSNEVWELSLAGGPTWSPLTPAGTPPGARAAHTAIHDPVGERMVVFGGTDAEDDQFHISHLNDTWVLSLGGLPEWSEPAGSAPPGLGLHSAIYRPAGDQVIVFGGYDGWRLHNDVWTYSPGAVPNWSRLAPSGPPPSARRGHSAIYDPVRDRMIVFGGAYGVGNDVWELILSGTPIWTQLVPLGSPPSARSQHSAIYDPVRDRMLVFGGYSYGYNGELWELTLSGTPTWAQLAPAGSLPAGRFQHSAIYDPAGDRMLVFGGISSSGLCGDVQSLSLSETPTWSALTPSGPPPPPTSEHCAIYDSARGRMVIFGGHTSLGTTRKVWGLSLGGPPTWSELLPSGTPPRYRSGAAAIYDPVRDRMVVQAGWWPTAFEYTYVFSDIWMLTWSDLVGVPAPESPQELELAASFPNPAVAGLTIRFALPAPGQASLVIYDLAGRRVKALLQDRAAAGPHEVRWDLHTERGTRAGAGVYFCVLRTAGARAVRRLVVLD